MIHILEQYCIAFCALTSILPLSSWLLLDDTNDSFVLIHSLPLLLIVDDDFMSLVDDWIPPPKAEIESIKAKEYNKTMINMNSLCGLLIVWSVHTQ